jgi:RNA-binding protein
MSLNKKEIRKFRAKAHDLNPIVMIGDKGLSENVITELNRALEDHELIKISIAAEREQRRLLTDELCQACGADLIQIIGKMSIIYRRRNDDKI